MISTSILSLKKRLQTSVIYIVIVNALVLISFYQYVTTDSSADSFVRFVKHGASRELSRPISKVEEKGVRKTILLWNMPERVSHPDFLDPNRCKSCIITKNRSAHQFSDAVVFSYLRIRKPEDLPARSRSKPDQVYVWMCRETPKTILHNYNYALKNFSNAFNWSMTYRSDSDVFYPYVEILHRMHDTKRMEANLTHDSTGFVDLYYKDVDSLMKRKKFLAAWVVGNCGNTPGARYRMDLVRRLIAAGLDVHRFGKCFKDNAFPPYRSEETHERLMEYKFYLAFENTAGCKDYITYKFWKNAIYSGAVPVVWGSSKEDVARLVPTKSFIHVDDFKSAADLVEYLNYLNTNDSAYREYFKWRENESSNVVSESSGEQTNDNDRLFSTREAFGFCKLCRMLHAKENDGTGESFHRKSIRSLEQWFYRTESDDCVSKS